MQNANTQTVFVVQVDNNKDLSDARRYGQLKGVFGKPRKPYDKPAMISKARRILEDWRPGDYLLMIGDPTLCAVCMTIIGEQEDIINVLSWDRDSFQYIAQKWDFGQLGMDFDDFETADD